MQDVALTHTTSGPERFGADAVTPADDAFEPGTAIEVRNRFDGRWSKGFEISAVNADGYRVVRLSDGRELPTLFDPSDIRRPRDRRRGSWWY